MVLAQQDNKKILPLENLLNIKEDIAISKVLQYFLNCGYTIPKTTVQNYVREGVVSELKNGRYYSKRNIVEIYIAQYLKDIFTLKEIKKINNKIFSYNNSYIDIYNIFVDIIENFNVIDIEEDLTSELLEFIYKVILCKYSKHEVLEIIENK